MNAQLSINFDQPIRFVRTRARSNDCDTSKAAAKAAVSRKADQARKAITEAVKAAYAGLTARQVSAMTNIDYIECQRRISECGLVKTSKRIDGCAVWVAPTTTDPMLWAAM